jgi:pimeloyl-ACP methyl ester carboxylesterase
MAHSGGTFLGLQAAARAPERFYAYVGISQIVRQLESERSRTSAWSRGTGNVATCGCCDGSRPRR